MSYYICKSLCIDEKAGKVRSTGTDNNVYAINHQTGREFRSYRRSEWEAGTKILREQGRAALEERIALDVLKGAIKFCSGKFRDWQVWYRKRVQADPLLRE
jgi:hypothetical protein